MTQQQIIIYSYYEDEIDCTRTGLTEILPLNQRFVATYVSLELNLVSNFTVPPRISIGADSEFKNILNAIDLTLRQIGDIQSFYITLSLDGSQNLYINVLDAAVATQYEVKCLVSGYFE